MEVVKPCFDRLANAIMGHAPAASAGTVSLVPDGDTFAPGTTAFKAGLIDEPMVVALGKISGIRAALTINQLARSHPSQTLT